MTRIPHSLRLGLALASALALLLAIAGSAAAATRTITFQETEKGSTFAYVDNAPTTTLKHGFPQKISAGDGIVLTNPLVEGGKRIGRLAAFCVATKTNKNFDAAGFMCNGTFLLPGGNLIVSAMIGANTGTEGAVTGGTGIYAGAHGTFLTKEEKGPISTVTVTLNE